MLSLESSAALDAPASFRCGLSHGDVRVYCAWKQTALPAFALSLPWLLFGPVTRTGLLREASNPLGFSPGSDVFAERTGVRLDGSLPAGAAGLLCMPVPDVLGVFWLPYDGARACGCFVSLPTFSGFRAEGFLGFSESRSEDQGEEWFHSRPVDPGGALTAAGVRLGAEFSRLSVGATLGGSFSERAPPGSFLLLHGSLRGNDCFAEALLGRTEAAYRGLDGGGFDGASAFSVSAGIEGPARTVKLSHAFCVDQPGFAPGPRLASRETAGIVLEQHLAGPAGLDIVCRAEAERGISRNAAGNRQKTDRYAAALKGKASRAEAAACVELNEPGGIDLSLTGAFRGTGGSPRLSLVSRLEQLGAACTSLTVLAALQLYRKDVRLSFESGIEEWNIAAAGLDALNHLRLRVSWSTRCALGK